MGNDRKKDAEDKKKAAEDKKKEAVKKKLDKKWKTSVVQLNKELPEITKGTATILTEQQGLVKLAGEIVKDAGSLKGRGFDDAKVEGIIGKVLKGLKDFKGRSEEIKKKQTKLIVKAEAVRAVTRSNALECGHILGRALGGGT